MSRYLSRIGDWGLAQRWGASPTPTGWGRERDEETPLVLPGLSLRTPTGDEKAPRTEFVGLSSCRAGGDESLEVDLIPLA